MNKLITIISIIIFASCGEITKIDADGNLVTIQETYSMDGLKYISRNIQDSRDDKTFLQSFYKIDKESRLLMRLEKLDNFDNGAIIDDEHKMHLAIKVTADLEDAKNNLLLCPLKRNWMMLATWEYAHPFPGQGQWATRGGDYEESLCLKHDEDNDQYDTSYLYFDVSSWYISQRTTSNNYGFVLKTDFSYTIHGDAATSFMPSLKWERGPRS